jgi:hypothetical protein
VNPRLEQAELLEKGIAVAAHLDQAASVQALVVRSRALMPALRGAAAAQALASLTEECFRALRRRGLRRELRELLEDVAASVTEGESLAELRAQRDWPVRLRALLRVAAGWYYLGKEEEARPVIEEARALLCQGRLDPPERARLACAYAGALRQAPVELLGDGIDELFENLTDVRDSFTTNQFFSLAQLGVVEAVTLAILHSAGLM